MSSKPKKNAEPGTTGHQWDGIEEWNNPLPRWWVWTFIACIIWGIGYVIAYPAWPLVHGATTGLLGFSTRGQVEEQIAKFDAANAPLETKLASADLTRLAEDPALQNYATQAGGAIFRNTCSQCHGSGAAGAKGFPNLLDDDWLWGGTIQDIAYTVRNGVRNERSDDARFSQMPSFGRDELLDAGQIGQVVQFVLQLSGQSHDADMATAGAAIFADNCSVCHGDAGTGDREQGAPNLTDAIWLYGGDAATITETVTNARFGVMPAWSSDFRSTGGLSAAEVNAVAAYVHQLGGGE